MLLLFNRLREDYDRIAYKALTTPTNTENLVELRDYVQNAREKELPELEIRMLEARHRSVELIENE